MSTTQSIRLSAVARNIFPVLCLAWVSATATAGDPPFGANIVPRSGSASFFLPSMRGGALHYVAGTDADDGYIPEETIQLRRLLVTGDAASGGPTEQLIVTVYKDDTTTEVLKTTVNFNTASFPFTRSDTTPATPGVDEITPSDDWFIVIENTSSAVTVTNLTVIVEWASTDQAGRYSVTQYGADGSDSADDTTALQAAIDAAEAAGGGVVYFPPGTYRTDAGLEVDAEGVVLQGAGLGVSFIQPLDSATFTEPVLAFTSASGSLDDCGLHDLTVDGNRSNTTSAVGNIALTDVRGFRCTGVRTRSSGGYGLFVTTTSTGSVTYSYDNHFLSIWSQDNLGNGQHYQSLKNSQLSLLRSGNDALGAQDGDGGIVFEGGASTTIEETTENVVTNVRLSDSGRFGLILDGITKYSIGDVMIHASQDSAVLLRNSNSDGSSNSGQINYCTLTGFVLRNNAQSASFVGYSGIETSLDDTSVNRITIADWEVTGANAAAASPGTFDVRGWRDFRFVGIGVSLCPGTTWIIHDGELTNGSGVSSARGLLAACASSGCGNASSSTNHGVHIQQSSAGTTSDIILADCRLDNSLTTSSEGAFEIMVEADCARIRIDHCQLSPGSAGQEIDVASSSLDDVRCTGSTSDASDGALPSTVSASSLTLPVLAQGGLVEITGSTDITTISLAPAGTFYRLLFTAGSPGDLLDGVGNLSFPSGDVSPLSGQVVTIVAGASSWFLASP